MNYDKINENNHGVKMLKKCTVLSLEKKYLYKETLLYMPLIRHTRGQLQFKLKGAFKNNVFIN